MPQKRHDARPEVIARPSDRPGETRADYLDRCHTLAAAIEATRIDGLGEVFVRWRPQNRFWVLARDRAELAALKKMLTALRKEKGDGCEV